MISYDNLWVIMKEKGISQYALIKHYGVSPGQITRMKRNESVSTHTIEMFCKILKCNVEDIMQYIPDKDWTPDIKKIVSRCFIFVNLTQKVFRVITAKLLKNSSFLGL